MNPTLPFAAEDVLSSPAMLSFVVRHSLNTPAYYELALEDGQGVRARWVVPSPLKQLAKHPVLLWQLPAAPLHGALSGVEAGPAQLISPRPDDTAALHTGLAQGVLRLRFDGQLLRGYYRLHRLPTGDDQLWQLTPTGRV